MNSDVFVGPTLCHICNAVLWHFYAVAGYIAPQPKSLWHVLLLILLGYVWIISLSAWCSWPVGWKPIIKYKWVNYVALRRCHCCWINPFCLQSWRWLFRAVVFGVPWVLKVKAGDGSLVPVNHCRWRLNVIFIVLHWNLVLYGNEPEELYDSSEIRARGWGGGHASRRWFSRRTLAFWSAVIVYDLLHFMESSLVELSFDANWRMRSSGF